MTSPDITHTWTWTGDRDLPDWLAGHHHGHHDRPVIHTVDGPRHLYNGWLVALWSDGAITVGSNTVADRVYGPDGIAGRLKRAEAAIAAITSHLDIGDAQAWCKYCRRAWKRLKRVSQSGGPPSVPRAGKAALASAR